MRHCLERFGIAPGQLVIEITESLMLDEEATAERQLQELSALGVGIALDDFGTGYSSLSYLQRLPLDHIKIDRSFIVSLADRGAGSEVAIVNAIINLAHSLGLGVIAEGIETADQLAIMKKLECDQFQGFLFGHLAPIPHLAQPASTPSAFEDPLPVPA